MTSAPIRSATSQTFVRGSEYAAPPPMTHQRSCPPWPTSIDRVSRSTPRTGATIRTQPLPSTAAHGRTCGKAPDHCVVVFVLADLQLSFLNTKRNDGAGKGDVHGTAASASILPDPRIPRASGRARQDAADGPHRHGMCPILLRARAGGEATLPVRARRRLHLAQPRRGAQLVCATSWWSLWFGPCARSARGTTKTTSAYRR
jgi:hypothetical protein